MNKLNKNVLSHLIVLASVTAILFTYTPST